MLLNEKIYGGVPEVRGYKTDFVVPACMFLLFLMGVAFIYSAQSYNLDELPLSRQFWVKQIIFFATVGLPVYVLLGWIDYKVLFTNAHIVYVFTVLLLVPLALKESFSIPVPFVETRYNSTRWIDFGPVSIQPSEFAKIGTCIMAAAMFARNKIGKFRDNFTFWIKLGLVFFVPILLIFLQPDLGSTLVFFPMAFAMLYISTLPKRFFAITLILFALVIAAVSVDIYRYNNFLLTTGMSAQASSKLNAFGSSSKLCIPMKDYQRNRILAFVAPDMVDPRGTEVTWNQRQSLISVGTGGIVGKGLAEGTQAKLGYLPSSVAYNDFIFSVLAEESGFVGGASAVVLMAAIVIYGCVRTAQLSRDKFGQFLCIGVAAILMTHTFINVGMTIGVMPITGVPLPMLSYGGTFVLTCCILLGLVQSVYRHRREYD